MQKAYSILETLNDKQKAAASHFKGPALVVAGPGSGKTRVLTHRIANLMFQHNVPEHNILCVTFTNKAAQEIKERVERILHENGTILTKLSWSGTFHSICSRILRRDGFHSGLDTRFVIFDTDDQESLIKQICKDFRIDTKQVNPRAVLSTISSAKSELISASEYEGYAQGIFQRNVAKIYFEYQKRLGDNNAVDFDDLIVKTVNLFDKHNEILEKYQRLFEFILIDEYQDTNKAQYVLAKVLSSRNRNLFVVGDMSQAIYSFRGADYRNILNFQRDYQDAIVYHLEQNYRSTQSILDAAKSMIKNNKSHIHLDLWTDKAEDEKIVLYTSANETDEANYIADQVLSLLALGEDLKEIAILYRTNAQSRTIEEALIKNKIPYKIIGGFRFYSRKEVKDIICYLRVIHNPKDKVAWERILNVPPRGIGPKTVQDIKASKFNLDYIEEKTKLPFKTWMSQAQTLSTIELLDEIVTQTKYIEWLDDGSEENMSRIENIKELRSVAAVFTNLSEFLENVALIESTDKPGAHEANAVTLMTIHASKGLEFKTVFLCGMEEGLFPHSRSIGSLEELEEERRLCYVAITRAMKKLHLTHALQRLYFGRTEANLASRFLGEIPQELLESKGFSVQQNSKGYGKNQWNTGSKGNDTKFIEDFFDEMELERRSFNW